MIAQIGETGAFEHYGTCRRDDKTVHHPSRFFDRHKVPGGPPTRHRCANEGPLPAFHEGDLCHAARDLSPFCTVFRPSVAGSPSRQPWSVDQRWKLRFAAASTRRCSLGRKACSHDGTSYTGSPHASNAQGQDDTTGQLNSVQQQARFDEFVSEFNEGRPHEAIVMKMPGEVYAPSSRTFRACRRWSIPSTTGTFWSPMS